MEKNAEKIIIVNRAMQVRKKAWKNSGLPGVEPWTLWYQCCSALTIELQL